MNFDKTFSYCDPLPAHLRPLAENRLEVENFNAGFDGARPDLKEDIFVNFYMNIFDLTQRDIVNLGV